MASPLTLDLWEALSPLDPFTDQVLTDPAFDIDTPTARLAFALMKGSGLDLIRELADWDHTFDPVNTPAQVLPWLAQFTGTVFDPKLTTAQRRQQLGDPGPDTPPWFTDFHKGPSNWLRGSRRGLEVALYSEWGIAPEDVTIRERRDTPTGTVDKPNHLYVETTSPGASPSQWLPIMRTVKRHVPHGVRLTLVIDSTDVTDHFGDRVVATLH